MVMPIGHPYSSPAFFPVRGRGSYAGVSPKVQTNAKTSKISDDHNNCCKNEVYMN